MDHQLHEVKHELALEKHKSGMIKASDSMAEKGLTGEGQGQMATMEMQVLNEKQRAELANARYVTYNYPKRALKINVLCLFMNDCI